MPHCLHRALRLGGRSRAVLVVAVVLAAASVSAPLDAATTVSAVTPPDQRVMLVSDSVGLGVQHDLHNQFPDDWDVSVVGIKSVSIAQLERDFVRPRLDQLGDHVVVAGGYNFPYDGGLAASIDSMVNTLTGAGVEHVYWVTLREVREDIVSPSAWRRIQPFYRYFTVVNDELDRAVGRHPELTLIDWAVAADRPGLTTDAIHLNRAGVELYGSLIRRAVDDTALRPPNGGVTRVEVVTPSQVASGEVEAVALNITSARGRDAGYLTAFPCDEDPPSTSNVNHVRDDTIAAAAIVRVDPSGDVCVYNHQAGHVVVDVFGHFGSNADIGDTEPKRALDTRSGRPLVAATERRIDVVDPTSQPPGGEHTVVLNLTAVRPQAAGYATVHDCSTGPGETSNVNFARASTRSNLVVVPASAAGDVCVTASANTHVLVDVLAVFGPESTVEATVATRLVDTRATGRPDDDTVVVDVPASMDASAGTGAFANLTIADAATAGYASVYPCDAGLPSTSNINFRAGTTIANAVLVEPDTDGRLCVFTSTDAHVIVDLMATTGSAFAGMIPTRALDSRT